MADILTSGSGLFPGWVSILFSLGLALGIIHHLPCLVFGHENRWFHAGHAAMALSMIYMYLSMSYDWNWLSAVWQMWFFVATTVAVAVYLLTSIARRRPLNSLWILLLVQHAAMIYMWYPMMKWNPIAIFVLVSWFAVETFGWAVNLFPDDVRRVEQRKWFPYEIRLFAGATLVSAGSAGRYADVAGGAEPAVVDCHTSEFLITSGWKDRLLMAVMALSMGYMFYGMQVT